MARKVIREGMDYESYLGGRVKEELDGLAGLAGRYVVVDAKLDVFDLKHGWKLVKAAWAWLKKEIPMKNSERPSMCRILSNISLPLLLTQTWIFIGFKKLLKGFNEFC